MEKDTIYAYRIQDIKNPTFEKVRDLTEKSIKPLRQSVIDNIYEQLNRGADMLDTEPQMLTYLYSFGKMHQFKLNRAFEQLPDAFLQQPEIRIVDYGCGQAIGTMCYADFLADRRLSQTIKSVTLIEPSEICLKRAALHVSQFFPDAEIHTICKTFDNLIDDDLANPYDIPTLHILSNVLDIQEFDLEDFATLIANNLNNYNQFVCVGPYFSYSDKDVRMSRFAELLNGNVSYSQTFEKRQLNPEKEWTAQIVCFSVGELEEEELSTKVNKYEKGIKDEFGAVYSKDGKRLLRFNSLSKKYSIKKGTRVICNNAFAYYGWLQTIIIPDSVTNIGNSAFRGCYSLKQINIPNSIRNIGNDAFSECDSLIQITIPDSVTNIGNCAFEWCKYLQQINIPDSVTNIGESAFFMCKSLQQITIPDSVTYIGSAAFTCCVNLNLKSNSKRFTITNKLLIDNIEHRLISYFGADKCIIIPDSVTSIGNMAFELCSSLKQIIIPDSVTSIGYCAFELCSSLKQIIIPDSVTSIGGIAFNMCSSLKQIIIPEGSTEKFKKMLEEELWDKLIEN